MKKNLTFIALLTLISIFAAGILAQTPQYYNINNGICDNAFPFNWDGGKAVNTLILAGELNQPNPLPSGKKIVTVYFRTFNAGTRVFTNLHILMAQSAITTLSEGSFYAGPYDTVYNHTNATLTSSAGGWMSITLDKEFIYDPSKSLILFVGQCSATGSGISVYNSSLTGIRRVWSFGGCPYFPYYQSDADVVNFGVDVIDAVGILPDEKANQDPLINNFPNPFSKTTTFAYQLSSTNNVLLKVYDLMGKEVSTLVNKSQTAGKYEVDFDATGLPSGIYVYRLTTNNYNISKRMIVEK